MIILLLLSVIIVDRSYATTNCLELHHQQLASLNERMNQMLSSLYSSPIISKLLSSSKSNPLLAAINEKEDSSSQEPSYYPTKSTPAQNIICVSPPQALPSTGQLLPPSPPIPNIPSYYPQPALSTQLMPTAQPVEYIYPGSPNWPKYYDYYTNPYSQYRPSYPSHPYPYPPSYEYYPPKYEYAPPSYPYTTYSPPTPQYTAPYIPPPAPYYPIPPY